MLLTNFTLPKTHVLLKYKQIIKGMFLRKLRWLLKRKFLLSWKGNKKKSTCLLLRFYSNFFDCTEKEDFFI